MYTAQNTIERIQLLTKEKGLTQKKLLSNCGINENTLKRMTDNKGISSFYLAKIADQLETSTDYLLGRTDNKEMNITITAAPTISRTGELSTTTTGGIEHITINEDTSETTEEKEILKMIKSLSAVQKARIILMIDEMKKEGEKNE